MKPFHFAHHRCFGIVSALLFSSVAAFGGVTYDFRSESTGAQEMTVDGSVAADGSNFRMTIDHGDPYFFRSGAVVLSRDGGKTVTVFDPASKTYYEMPIEQLTAGIAALQSGSGITITFANPTSSVTDGGAGEAIEGLPTQKTRIDGSIVMTMDAMGQKINTRISMQSENWTTDKLSAAAMNVFQQRALRTGIDALDKLFESQAASLKGRFPLKQVTTVTMTQNGHAMTATTVATVTNIKQKALDAAAFAAPAGYTKTDNPVEAMKKRAGM